MAYYKSYEQQNEIRRVRFYLRGSFRRYKTSPFEMLFNINNFRGTVNFQTGASLSLGKPSEDDIDYYKRLLCLSKNFLTDFQGFATNLTKPHLLLSSLSQEPDDACDVYIAYRNMSHLTNIQYKIGDYIALCSYPEDEELSVYFPMLTDWNDDYYLQSMRFTKVLSIPQYHALLRMWLIKINTKDLHNDYTTL